MTTLDDAMHAGFRELAARGDLCWCPRCQLALPKERERLVLVPRVTREPVKHYDFSYCYVPVCECGDVMEHLCVDCRKAPSQDGLDQCLKCWPPGADAPLSDFRRDRTLLIRPLVKGNAT